MIALVLGAAWLPIASCHKVDPLSPDGGDADSDADSDSDTGPDYTCTAQCVTYLAECVNGGGEILSGLTCPDQQLCCDFGGIDSDSDTDADTDTGPFVPDCSGCTGVGTDKAAMLCAVDLCDPATVIGHDYSSPTGSTLTGTAAAVAHFGDPSNDLAPLLNGSYALMATGPATGTSHSQSMGGNALPDPFTSDGYSIYDTYEWRLDLQAPPGAHGFQVHYVFLSVEYDEYVSTVYNDKFYIILEAGSTNGGAPTVINWSDCRDPTVYSDFSGDDCDSPSGHCCYVAINSALSECCWYDGCPQDTWTTDVSGTGFSCADSQAGDTASTGSSTGWLRTEWPIEPGEVFTLTFHIHDTSDGIFDSEVIIDRVLFVGVAQPGTTKVE
jgi:hypothetical protein